MWAPANLQADWTAWSRLGPRVQGPLCPLPAATPFPTPFSPLNTPDQAPPPSLCSKSPPCFSHQEQNPKPNRFEHEDLDSKSVLRTLPPVLCSTSGPCRLSCAALWWSGHRVLLWNHLEPSASHRKVGGTDTSPARTQARARCPSCFRGAVRGRPSESRAGQGDSLQGMRAGALGSTPRGAHGSTTVTNRGRIDQIEICR